MTLKEEKLLKIWLQLDEMNFETKSFTEKEKEIIKDIYDTVSGMLNK